MQMKRILEKLREGKSSKNQLSLYSFLAGVLLALIFFQLGRKETVRSPPKMYFLSFGQPLTRESCFSIGSALSNEIIPVIYTGKMFDTKGDLRHSAQEMDGIKRKKPSIFKSMIDRPFTREEDLLVMGDLYDVLFLQDRRILAEKFSRFEAQGKRVMFSGEMNYHPFYERYHCPPYTIDSVKEMYNEVFGSSRPTRVINSGVIFGRKKYMREFINAWNFNIALWPNNHGNCWDDQGQSSLIMLENSNWISFDMYNELTLHTIEVNYESLIFKKLRETFSVFDKRTNSYPGVIHFNGDDWQDSRRPKLKNIIRDFYYDFPHKKLEPLYFFLDDQYVTFKNACGSFDFK